MSGFDTYKTPLDSRYSSAEMKALFSQRSRHGTWRKLWIYLAEAQKELGIDSITDEAISQMQAHLTLTDEDFKTAAVEEKRRKHDVMAHVHAFGAVAPAAAGIIHYGATSCYVTDNAELILMRDGMDLLLPKLAKVIDNLAQFALKWKSEPTLGYTHYQPAQMITVGKRVAEWAQELMMDLENIEHVRKELKFRGAQGTTGTQASFMEIFHDDTAKIDRLNELLCEKAGFPACYDVSTQTYTRKVDLNVANAIAGLGATVIRITSDIRHLANMKEMEEPFDKDQIGSSAMAYKRNPMRSERIASLGRKLASLPVNFSSTFSSQWMERSLDDSAIRRIDIPEMFLLADAVLIGMDNVSDGLVLYPKRIDAHNREELPFMATENLIMKLVAKGGSRQEAHEEIRVLSHQASDVVKNQGGKNDLIERIKSTEYFKPVWDEVDAALEPKLYIGRSPEIVDRFCGKGGVLEKKLMPYRDYIKKAGTAQLNV
ncbi:adenylosuccinate lyase [Pseudomassariella vexata]|uniref:Adenylosuccinate lyase n=1 Tax=Pseudomassariella vexata TaxID=1141098 RepID=A0A1Y2DQ65_9PEZI|nr:adenylosuccinate lyase [Pseudomassariella vexata]ORY61284.1 adenylosuccinate lyase [Pseudomassariella vexata]